MSEKYVICPDLTITRVPKGAEVRMPFFYSLTAAAVHSGVRMTCFTKEGIRSEPFPNPLPDPSRIDVNAFPERRHYFVQMTDEGELHAPPLMPEEAAAWYLARQEISAPVFEYDAENVTPEF